MVLAEFVRAIKGSAPTSSAHQHFNLLMAMVEIVILLMLTHYSIFGLLCLSPLMTLVKFVKIITLCLCSSLANLRRSLLRVQVKTITPTIAQASLARITKHSLCTKSVLKSNDSVGWFCQNCYIATASRASV